MKVYLYCRVSTEGQTVEPQLLQSMARFPGAIIRAETASGIKERPVLEALTAELAEGDTLVVAALDRLGRRTIDILSRLEQLLARGVRVESLREGPVSNGATGKFLVSIMASFAEMERTLISERTKQALASLKTNGVKLGRPTIVDDPLREHIVSLSGHGHTVRSIAKLTGLTKSTVHNHLKAAKADLSA